MAKSKYYSLNHILKADADYNIIFGERSNGKTYAALLYGITNFVNSRDTDSISQFAYLRRWKEDITGKRASQIFDSLVHNNEISKLTEGKYTNVSYSNGAWYLSYMDTKLNKMVLDTIPCCYAFALSDMEHDKSASFPNIDTIIFDEFLTRKYYLADEFITFVNVLSTIIRQRDNVKIFMIGNTVNRFSPYFKELGIDIETIKQGKISVFTYANDVSPLKIAVDYCGSKQKKSSDKYFAFNNPKLNMITSGKWEIDFYPHLPEGYKIKGKDIIFSYFMEFNDKYLQCDIVMKDNDFFTFIHEKTTPIKHPDTDLIYSLSDNIKSNYRRNILMPTNENERKIAWFYKANKVFYSDNETGEIVRNYIMLCMKRSSGNY